MSTDVTGLLHVPFALHCGQFMGLEFLLLHKPSLELGLKHAVDKPFTFCSFLQIVPAMDSTGCYFSDLPTELCDAVLQQAFKQLDQRHQYGIAPLVCRLWHTLSVSCSSSIDVEVKTEAAGESLISWVGRNGSNLTHFRVSFAAFRNNGASLVPKQLLQTAVSTAANQLENLQFQGTRSRTLCDVRLPRLNHLTTLAFTSCHLPPDTVSSLSAQTQSRSLDISSSSSISGPDTNSMIMEVSTKLTGLTSLDLSHTSIWLGKGMSSESIRAITASLSQLSVLRLEDVKVSAHILANLGPKVTVLATGISTAEDTSSSVPAAFRGEPGGA